MPSKPTLPARAAARIRARLARFAGDTGGTVTLEAVIMLPVLVWAFFALYTFFDAYRQSSMNHKAAYTISDMISRETNPIDDDFLDGSYQMLSFLTRSNNVRRLRVSVVRYDADSDEYSVLWSHTRGGMSAYATGTISGWQSKLPVMVDEERLILVETWADFSAPFDVGLNNQVISTFVFTRPRFGQPQICWDTCA